MFAISPSGQTLGARVGAGKALHHSEIATRWRSRTADSFPDRPTVTTTAPLRAYLLPSMFFRSRRSRGRRWWGVGASRALPGVLSTSELESACHQERARVDRNGRCFSVLVCRVQARTEEEFAEVAEVLASRMRAYDRIGSLDAERLALLLPESDGRGAWVFADDTLDQLAEMGHRVDCEVFTYPVDRGGRDGLGLRPAAAAPFGTGAPTEPPPPRRPEPVFGPVDRDDPDEPEAPPRRGTGTDGPAPDPAPKQARPHPSASLESFADLRPATELRPVRDLYPYFLQELPLWRRAADVAVAATLLTLLLPLFAVVAVAVLVTSPGPIFFVQWRAGRGGRPFRFYKFRSMYVDAEQRKSELSTQNEQAGPIFKMRHDPRITPLGRWLRKASIDELPQLWNVLLGDMTLVGPRPPTLDEVAAYERWQRERLDITGGLTCIWQVSGRSEIGFEEWVRMDLEYKRKRSARFDLKLLWRTIGAVFTGRGAY
jgi:lipopolysaccharide/colanic/teichoic acid biosynthesis glycosyltransferase